jgi:hypothetical protein
VNVVDIFARRTRFASLLVAVVWQLSGTIASAALVPIPAPLSVLPGALESNTNAYLFVEKQVVLPYAVTVDISVPGLYNNSNPGSISTIPAGTRVQSYFIHRDPVGNAYGTVLGAAISPTKILGIIYSDALLDATDALLGNAGTLYPTGVANRGMEIPYAITPDVIGWNANYIAIAFQSNAAAVTDQMRILAVVPEPTSAALLALGGLGLVYLAARRRFC